jgi:uncharacterized protein YfkK (UPF0435 family)
MPTFEKSLKSFNEQYIFLKLISRMINSQKNITIDTGIYEHYNNNSDSICSCCDDAWFDENMDIIEIYGNEDKPISFEDIMDGFKEIRKQLKILNSQRCDKPNYYYEGIKYDKDTDIYSIIWNTQQ